MLERVTRLGARNGGFVFRLVNLYWRRGGRVIWGGRRGVEKGETRVWAERVKSIDKSEGLAMAVRCSVVAGRRRRGLREGEPDRRGWNETQGRCRAKSRRWAAVARVGTQLGTRATAVEMQDGLDGESTPHSGPLEHRPTFPVSRPRNLGQIRMDAANPKPELLIVGINLTFADPPEERNSSTLHHTTPSTKPCASYCLSLSYQTLRRLSINGGGLWRSILARTCFPLEHGHASESRSSAEDVHPPSLEPLSSC